MKLKYINDAISNAKSQDYLASLPPSFLTVNIQASHAELDGEDGDRTSARIEHFTSPLQTNLMDQCLKLFEENMGDLYRLSSWGLDMEEKRNEFTHDDARFLIILSEGSTLSTSDIKTHDNKAQSPEPTVLGFAHYRYEHDDEEDPTAPVSYLYELQIQSTQQKAGLGKRLMNIIELLALKSHMHKVMLTVFKVNTKAMGFYLNKMKYEVDECSPSNFEGEENENCDYEILSKSLVVR
jgi:GNAT superfamily N-acetyltransferase